jgi:hypothetical protein
VLRTEYRTAVLFGRSYDIAARWGAAASALQNEQTAAGMPSRVLLALLGFFLLPPPSGQVTLAAGCVDQEQHNAQDQEQQPAKNSPRAAAEHDTPSVDA